MKSQNLIILKFFVVAMTAIMVLAAPAGYAGEPFQPALFPVLAETPGAETNWLLLAGAALIGALAYWVVQAVLPVKDTKVEMQSQPIQVTISEELHKQFASRTDFNELKARFDQSEHRCVREMAAIRKDGEERKDQILSKVSEEVGCVHDRINDINNNMPQRIVTLLQTTGALKKS